MYYTIGHTENYEIYFKEQGTPKKKGRDYNHNGEYYSGGAIWKTRDQAQSYLIKNNLLNYSVYGVLCNDKDVEVVEGQEWMNLLVDSDLEKLNKNI